MFISSPKNAPRARQIVKSMLCPAPMTPFDTVSIFSIAPAMPMNRTLIPQARLSPSRQRSFMRLPPSRPHRPPATIAAPLTSVPIPIIVSSKFLKKRQTYRSALRFVYFFARMRTRNANSVS